MALRLPTLVIVGRPNVGKSTMFNRLIGYRLAVVEDTPGVTRDRIYAESQWKGWKYRVVDTGGILFGDEDPLVDQIRTQAEVAMAEADVVLFVTDSVDGVHPADWALAEYLRGFKRPVYLVVNKADNQERVDASPEFYSLGVGEDVFPVSALQDKGFDKLLSHVFEGLAKHVDPNEEPVDELRLAIIGRPNVGKSSMLNAFSGEQRAIVSDIPGTTRDAIDSVVEYKGRTIRLIDTAGIRRRGKVQGSIEFYMVLRAQRALERAECALVVIDGQEGLTDGDKRVAKMSLEMGKPLVIAVNKWDLIEPPTGQLGKTTEAKKEFTRQIRAEIPEMDYAVIRFTSAQEASGMDGVMKAVFTAVDNWKFRAPTGPLNRLIQDAQFDKPLTRKGQPFKIKFATQAESMPPTFVLFCNNPDLFHFSYQRYIENQLRKKFPLPGTPIRIVSRKSGEDRED
ncbi:MAG: ribosome biogenesis GTPase Der [Armatimonadetes bacterium]|nr:ribosome biogenesis GTPase Der [Armatimonadota bacterium]MBS1711380.1 ribosome biogenesis GTPase Der [Armatimonadota bacterium]MBX3107695.1 ribosome biogenesis GTPase Der [Fimbriimonadaceae bacterium]